MEKLIFIGLFIGLGNLITVIGFIFIRINKNKTQKEQYLEDQEQMEYLKKYRIKKIQKKSKKLKISKMKNSIKEES